MKNIRAQVAVAIVCSLLGFLLMHQYKVLSAVDNEESISNSQDIISEIESLKKEKEELSKTNAELTEQLKKIEDNATKNGEVEKEVKNQLDSARMQLGLVDVKGPGVTITITPKNNIFSSGSSDTTTVGDEELVHLVNLLWFSKAEAISINNYRVTPQTGIKVSGSWIWIGTAGKISPSEPIVIEAIGDKNRLNVGVTFQSSVNLRYKSLVNYNVEVKQTDDIVMEKTTQTLKNDHITPVSGK
ncbi:MAG: DUF881 domain-containing protein [Clostridiaceae bacterium]|nr:DUF881 domain-containing protein [Clostridiaceae bacterium]